MVNFYPRSVLKYVLYIQLLPPGVITNSLISGTKAISTKKIVLSQVQKMIFKKRICVPHFPGVHGH